MSITAKLTNNILRIASICASAAILFALLIPPASAQGLGGFALHAITSEITVNEDGSFDVTETIQGDYAEYRRGLFRFIPFEYEEEGDKTRIHLSMHGVKRFDHEEGFLVQEPFEFYREGPFKVIKIGDPDVSHIGTFEYHISYRVENALLYHEVRDELFWNVTGDEWGVPIPRSEAVVHISGVEANEFLANCYGGAFGSTESCAQNFNQNEEMRFVHGGPMTISVQFPKGIVAEPSTINRLWWWLAYHWDFFFLLIPLFTLIVLIHVWYHHGKDHPSRSTVVPEYEPPNGLRPTEVGTLVDAKLHPKDFAAGIIDLAVRGYVQIVEEEKKALRSQNYRFKKLKPADKELKPYEKEIYDALLGGGDDVSMTSRQTVLFHARDRVAKKIYQSMADEGYFVKNPQTARTKMIAIGIAFAVFGHILGMFAIFVTERPLAHIAFFATAALFIIFGFFMPKKTEKGAIAFDMAEGFKLYLEKAEKYRIEWQEKEGLFEKFLPYAMVYGVADKWAKALRTEVHESPSWYVGPSLSTFDPVTFSNSVSSFVNSAAKVSAPSSSGGGSSGGGGFSGGGFGGGGGGSW